MQLFARYLLLSAACLCQCSINVFAQSDKLLDLKPDPMLVAQLGEAFEDAQISIRPPRRLKRIDLPTLPEFTRRGVHSYGWTPDGVAGRGSPENLSVTLMPFAQPSSDALDKMIEGMQESIQAKAQPATFGKVQRGTFNGFEVRSGSFTTSILGEKVIAYYLVSIDRTGSFAVTAMLPYSKATPEEKLAAQTSVLTFRRSKPAGSSTPIEAP
jgi:hypothetical protein